MGIFQRFEDEPPSLPIAGFVGLAILLVGLPLTLCFRPDSADKSLQMELGIIITFSAAGVATAITLGKLGKP